MMRLIYVLITLSVFAGCSHGLRFSEGITVNETDQVVLYIRGRVTSKKNLTGKENTSSFTSSHDAMMQFSYLEKDNQEIQW